MCDLSPHIWLQHLDILFYYQITTTAISLKTTNIGLSVVSKYVWRSTKKDHFHPDSGCEIRTYSMPRRVQNKGKVCKTSLGTFPPRFFWWKAFVEPFLVTKTAI